MAFNFRLACHPIYILIKEYLCSLPKQLLVGSQHCAAGSLRRASTTTSPSLLRLFASRGDQGGTGSRWKGVERPVDEAIPVLLRPMVRWRRTEDALRVRVRVACHPFKDVASLVEAKTSTVLCTCRICCVWRGCKVFTAECETPRLASALPE